MTRGRIWLVVAVLFSMVNLVAAGMAASQTQWVHAGIHVALSLLGFVVVWRMVMRSNETNASMLANGDPRLEQLQQSVDAIAIEVERIGESQRFNEKLKAQQREHDA